MKAPGFSLPDQDGKPHQLSDYKGTWVVLYFYPKDDTPGCTKEACNFRDGIYEFKKRGVQILGISKDTVRSHKKFADKIKLSFPLLSDTSLDTIKAYGAWGERKFWGRTFDGVLRNTYIIDPEGNIAKAYERVNPLSHAETVIRELDDLRS